ncbi:MAG: hypothetical protein WCZ66_02990 [Sphingomonadaceae bacterium]
MKLLTFAILACVGGAVHAAPVSFQTDIVPILKTRCAACHMTGQEAGKLALTPAKAYGSLVDARALDPKFVHVRPGKPDESYLMMKLEGTHLKAGGAGMRMPMGMPPLDAGVLTKFRTWIAEGAKAQ